MSTWIYDFRYADLSDSFINKILMRYSIVTGCLLSVAAFARDNNHDMHASPVLAKLALKKAEGKADKPRKM